MNDEEKIIELQLFRIHINYPSQLSIFQKPESSPKEIIEQIIYEYPSLENYRGHTWHIGNIKRIDNSSFYFRIGRTTKLSVELYVEGNFIDSEFETSPYTHVFIDTDIELCAIAKKTKLLSHTSGIANQLGKLFNSSKLSESISISFEIKEIDDPSDFIHYIKTSFAIKNFCVILPPSNAWDVDKYFTQPTQQTIQQINAKKSKTEFLGDKLNPGIIEKIARTAASLGSDASAVIQQNEQEKPVKKKLKGNKITIPVSEKMIDEQLEELMNIFREKYYKVRKLE